MKLVYEANGNDVLVGDIVKTGSGEEATVTGIQTPHHGGSTGRVSVAFGMYKEWPQQFFPSVIGAVWIDREDHDPKSRVTRKQIIARAAKARMASTTKRVRRPDGKYNIVAK